MMISKKTLEAVRNGVITDEQLLDAIDHYTMLERYLRPHGERYNLVWFDAKQQLEQLERMLELRRQDQKRAESLKVVR